MTTFALKYYQTYGSNAQSIYKKCCRYLGFDATRLKEFGLCQDLYADQATPEGYGVWFLAHNTWTEDSSANYRNEIYDDIIDEFWQDFSQADTSDKEDIRLVFAKISRSGDYRFLGVYKRIEIDKEKSLKRFQCIQDDYKL